MHLSVLMNTQGSKATSLPSTNTCVKKPQGTVENRREVGYTDMPEMDGRGREVPVSLDNLRDKNLMQLKRLNTAIFPVRCNDKYYSDALSSGDFSMLAYYSDICVGSIACRLEKKEEGGVSVYIMTLGVLAPYRGLGIGSKLLKHCLDLCSRDPNIVEIYLHVQTNNEEAISFYKKFGFEIVDTIKNYYRNINPPDCFVARKTLNPVAKTKGSF